MFSNLLSKKITSYYRIISVNSHKQIIYSTWLDLIKQSKKLKTIIKKHQEVIRKTPLETLLDQITPENRRERWPLIFDYLKIADSDFSPLLYSGNQSFDRWEQETWDYLLYTEFENNIFTAEVSKDGIGLQKLYQIIKRVGKLQGIEGVLHQDDRGYQMLFISECYSLNSEIIKFRSWNHGTNSNPAKYNGCHPSTIYVKPYNRNPSLF